MNLYDRKSRWKIYLLIAGLAIVGISMFVTTYLSDRLVEGERNKVETYLLALEKISDPNLPPNFDVTYLSQILTSNKTIPVILVDDRGEIISANNFGKDLDTNSVYLQKQLETIYNEGRKPISVSGSQLVYYKNSRLLTLLTYFPYFQLFLIGSFILFGYFMFSSARRAEQNQVWVGMAKETAHQLGTPISAILGWIEHLRAIKGEDEDTMEVVTELRNDVTRLELIAERFSKIGSEPKLTPINIYKELEECRAYMQRRAPRKVSFDFPKPSSTPLMVNINPPLFDWVIENLLRNALDAMPGKGEISAKVYDDIGFIYVDVSDTGKGIPPSKHKTVFQPGFTTKKRGWGLGLSLAKRIVESYHSGKIFVKRSVENEGTTFTIKLPKS